MTNFTLEIIFDQFDIVITYEYNQVCECVENVWNSMDIIILEHF